MSGRVEHKIKTEESLERLISDKPKYVIDYYYSISNAEHKTKSVYIYGVCHFLAFLKENGVNINNVKNLNQQNVNMYFAAIRYTTKGGEKRPTSKSLFNTRRSTLNSFFNFLVSMDYIRKNPIENVKRIKGNDNVKRVYMTGEDLKEVIAKVKKNESKEPKWVVARNLAAISVFIQTGVRATALTEIDISDVEIVMSRDNTVDRVYLNITDKEDKFYKRQLSGDFAKYFCDWLVEREKLNVSCNAVFLGKNYDRISLISLERMVKRYSPIIDGKQITPHKYRATYGTTLYKATGDIFYVQKQMGHASPTTTEIYIVEGNEDEAKASDIMANIIR